MASDPILEAIEEGRFASARRDLESKLKRFPDKSYYLALNCFYLAETGNASAEAQCRTLKQKVPSDAKALDLLARAFKKLGLPTDANEIYENAVKKYPTTDLILTWFFKTIHSFDTRSAQKASMLLKKHAKSNRAYAVRAAFVNFLWSLQSPSEKESTLHLALAESILNDSSPLESNQEIFALATILSKRGKYDQVVELLAPLDHRELELTLLYLDCLFRLENWEALYNLCHQLLFKEEFNDYDTWKYLIMAAKNLGKSETEISTLISSNSRNAYMAKIELAKVYESNIETSVLAYYDSFATKPCCVADLSLIELFPAFVERIHSDYSELLSKEKLSPKEESKLCNLSKLNLRIDPNLKLSWSQFAKFDSVNLIDTYLICMIDDLRQDSSPENIVKHIVHLEHLAKQDSENYRVKLWLLNLYTNIGASTKAIKVFHDLKIKMIQNDTLSYKLDLAPSLANLNELVQVFRFYLTSDSEVESFIQKGFEMDLYTKIQDFYQFGQRLSNSLTRHLVILRILQISRVLNHSYYNYFYKVVSDMKTEILSDCFTVSDNRDFKTEYNLGAHLSPLEFLHGAEQRKGKEYAKLYYLKELLIVERKEADIQNMLKAFNKILSNPSHMKQFSAFEAHLFKMYLSLFKVAKDPKIKDKASEIGFLAKNLDFKKIKPKFMDNLPPLSNQINHILAQAFDFACICPLLVSQPQLVKAASTLRADISAFEESEKQKKLFRKIKSSNSFEDLPQDFVSDTLEDIIEGVRSSSLKLSR
ncbi:putative N-terminal acetyltransferase complex subunit [Clavispora lusitaniae]|uniref:N-terminal acetyltransferase complex subunit n=1 Tax=Clavispora lusitaniae TaxID=36911 RepID=A0AA91PZ63_CLALS|nr:putative N-terminal acetyltransferase complex subunit [Clavispora lusitaniae]